MEGRQVLKKRRKVKPGDCGSLGCVASFWNVCPSSVPGTQKEKKFFLLVVVLVIHWSREERPLLSLKIFWFCFQRQMSHYT